MGFYHVSQARLELLTLGDPPASTSQNTEITGVSHCARLGFRNILEVEAHRITERIDIGCKEKVKTDFKGLGQNN